MDIIILLLCAFLIINKLMKMLGQYDGDSNSSRIVKNGIITDLLKQRYNNAKVIDPKVISTSELNLTNDVRSVLNQIREYDDEFDIDRFFTGAKKAYNMCIQAIINNDIETITYLMDKELFDEIKNNDNNVEILSIEKIELINAALFGDRAVLTVKMIALNKSQNITFCRYLTQDKIWKITKLS